MAEQSLGTRLRELRLTEWPDQRLNQDRVAAAIGVSSPSISSYEKDQAVPPPERLRRYAILFASRRWIDPGAPPRLTLDFLDPDEKRRFDVLDAELRRLRDTAQQPSPTPSAAPVPFWRFPDGAPVRIFCGRLDTEDAGRYSTPDDPNYMFLRNAADVDSLVELWGHVRRLNPESDVRFVLGNDYRGDDLATHLVVLGNIARTQGAGKLIPDGTLPVRQVDSEHLDGEVFEIDRPEGGVEKFEPVIEHDRVVEDVSLVARVPNPHHRTRTLTVCSGVFTRGVYGAVRSLTSQNMRDGNAESLRERHGDLATFAVLFRTRVAEDAVVTPDLSDKRNRLWETDIQPS